MVSRIAFAIEDLGREIRALCADNPDIAITLDSVTYRAVVSQLEHGGHIPPGIDGQRARVFHGIAIAEK